MNKALSNDVIWFLVAGYFLWVLADSFFHPASTGVSATVNVFFVIAIATLTMAATKWPHHPNLRKKPHSETE